MKRIIRFLFVGCAGFVVDYSVFNACVQYFPDFISRIISIFFAILFTWSLNRNFTFEFKERNKIKEFIKYFLASKFSVGVNYVIFLLVLNLYSLSYLDSYIIATIASSVSNYLLYRSI